MAKVFGSWFSFFSSNKRSDGRGGGLLSLAGLMDDEVSDPPATVAHKQQAIYHPPHLSPPKALDRKSVV